MQYLESKKGDSKAVSSNCVKTGGKHSSRSLSIDDKENNHCNANGSTKQKTESTKLSKLIKTSRAFKPREVAIPVGSGVSVDCVDSNVMQANVQPCSVASNENLWEKESLTDSFTSLHQA